MLRACNSPLSTLQYNGVILLYALLIRNFPLTSLSATIAISRFDVCFEELESKSNHDLERHS